MIAHYLRAPILMLLLILAVCLLVAAPARAHHSDDSAAFDDLLNEMVAGGDMVGFGELFPRSSFYDDLLHPPGAAGSFPPGAAPTTYASAVELTTKHTELQAIVNALTQVDEGRDNRALVLSDHRGGGGGSPLQLVSAHDLAARPTRQLKAFVANREVICEGCVEKSNLVELAASLRLAPTIHDRILQQLTPFQTSVAADGPTLAHLGPTTKDQDDARRKELELAEVLNNRDLFCSLDNETNALQCRPRQHAYQ